MKETCSGQGSRPMINVQKVYVTNLGVRWVTLIMICRVLLYVWENVAGLAFTDKITLCDDDLFEVIEGNPMTLFNGQ